MTQWFMLLLGQVMPLEMQSMKKAGRGNLANNLFTLLITVVILVGRRACKNTGVKNGLRN